MSRITFSSVLRQLLLLWLLFLCANSFSSPGNDSIMITLNAQIQLLRNELNTNRKMIDSLKNNTVSEGIIKDKVSEYYDDVDQYYKHINTTVAILGFLFAMINIVIIAYGLVINSRSKRDLEALKVVISQDTEKSKDETRLAINGMESRTSEILSLIDKIAQQFNDSGKRIMLSIEEKENAILHKADVAEKNITIINEAFYKALSMFIDKLVAIQYNDNALQKQLLAASQRLQFLSFDPQVKSMALLSLAYTGDESDKGFLTEIIENQGENGNVRLAAKEAYDLLCKRILENN